MAQMAQVDRREIHFYTEAAIDLQVRNLMEAFS